MAADSVVQKIAEDFGSSLWVPNRYNRGVAAASVSQESAPDARTKGSQNWSISFSANDFEWCTMEPPAPAWIPGEAKQVRLRAKISDDRYGLKLNFIDGWGRDKVDGKAMEIELKTGATKDWQTLQAQIPADWVKPIRLAGISTHNWNTKGQATNIQIAVDELEVETNIGNVDPKSGRLTTWKPNPAAADKAASEPPVTPLVSASIAPGRPNNVFAGVQPSFSMTVRSWLSKPVTGQVQWKLLDFDGKALKQGSGDIRVEDAQSLSLNLETPSFGLYRIQASGELSSGNEIRIDQPLAYIPKPVELSEADKDASPYGLNVLAARKPMVGTFKSAGIIWYRDYGFDYEWMVRAKGADRSYSGWPWYPQFVKMYEDHGVRVLAVTKNAIKPPQADGKIGPSAEWRREMASIVMAFPYIRHYELDNEYDLHSRGMARDEVSIDWANYRAYHKVFGEIVQLFGAGEYVAVENGRAGVFPERVRDCVNSGDFAPIDVINSHHYTGTDAPEVNVMNYNVGIESGEATLNFFDQLRAAKRAGASDGKPRQHWLTEFGWDTKAGPIVTPKQQAIYLSRGFMMAMAAGCGKAFWFFDVDSPKAVQMFDGCGLMTDDEQPNLSLCAMAGLTQVLPRPQFVGMLNAGEGTGGYLFRNDDKLVAAMFTLEKENGPKIDFGSAKLFDYLGNPLPAGPVTLTPAPVFAVGVADDSQWARQAAYMLKSPYLVSACSGDEITAELQVKNSSKGAIKGSLLMELPQGWTNVGEIPALDVAPGQTAVVPLQFRVNPQEGLGEKTIHLAIAEGEPLVRIPLRVQTREPIGMSVRGLQGEPGESAAVVRLVNFSAKPLDGAIELQLPSTWKAPQTKIAVADLKPGERREVPVKLTWSAQWAENEFATARYTTSDGRSSEQPLIPSQLTMHKAGNMKMDGDLSDWPSSARLPGWVLGSTHGQANAELYLAWSEKGLYVGAKVKDSKASVPDPRAFWGADCLEVFIDTRGKKSARKYEPGDHQFWLNPMVDQKRVYVGQWKRGTETGATRYDISGIESASAKTPDGYTMECLIPASQLQGFSPKAGQRLGVSLNLSVKGSIADREVYWVLPKADATADHPEGWGSVLLKE